MKDKLLVFQSDFGLFEGTVSQMHGIAIRVDPTLRIFDLSHLISKFNTWDTSYSLYQTCHAWPEETVFVSVIDTGVGSVRKSVVAKTSAGHYRDVYAYTGARLASGVIDFERVGPGFLSRTLLCMRSFILCMTGKV
jgi:S-adenosylmethionine hydrolase